MIQFYHPSSLDESFPKSSQEDHLRSFLLSARNAHNGSIAPALLFSAFVLKFHEPVFEVLRLSSGAVKAPKFLSSKKAGLLCKSFSNITSIKDGVNVVENEEHIVDFLNSSDGDVFENILVEIPFSENMTSSVNSKGIFQR